MFQLIAPYTPPWSDAIRAALAGDALGVPHEFKAAHAVPRMDAIEMRMPDSYRKTYEHVPYGTCSDDGAQMLALMDVLQQTQGRFDRDMYGRALLDWYNTSKYQPGGLVFDIGGQTRDALEAFANGRSMRVNESACGNGSLMRVLPCAALPDTYGIERDAALQIAIAQSAVTHPARMTRAACALYVQLCWEVQRSTKPLRELVTDALVALAGTSIRQTDVWPDVQKLASLGTKQMPTGSGYVVDTFWSAVWAVDRSACVNQALRMAISLGDDTDTTACVTGGLAGIRFGLDEKTVSWCAQMVPLE